LPEEIRLIVRGDDFGLCHSANEAVLKCFKEGILTSASLMVSAPWFLEAAEICKENPELAVGVHLTLTCEWNPYRWKPVLPTPEVSTLVDENGYFRRHGQELLAAQPDLDQIEKEMRAQVEIALRKGIDVAYLDSHMFVGNATPSMKTIVEKIAKDYRLPAWTEGGMPMWLGSNPGQLGEVWTKDDFFGSKPEEKLNVLLMVLENLGPGLWLFAAHPSLDTPEMRAINSRSPRAALYNVAAIRDAETKALTSPEVKEMVKRKGIRLVGYRALRDEWRRKL